MAMSSFNALNKIKQGSMLELNDCIACALDSSIPTVTKKPCGLHFLVQEKIFKGTNQPFVSCPIQFLLRDQTQETKLFQPVWTAPGLRSSVNRKAKLGVKVNSVIRLDDFSVVAHQKAPSGYLLFVRSYHAVKKNVDKDACERWMLDWH